MQERFGLEKGHVVVQDDDMLAFNVSRRAGNLELTGAQSSGKYAIIFRTDPYHPPRPISDFRTEPAAHGLTAIHVPGSKHPAPLGYVATEFGGISIGCGELLGCRTYVPYGANESLRVTFPPSGLAEWRDIVTDAQRFMAARDRSRKSGEL